MHASLPALLAALLLASLEHEVEVTPHRAPYGPAADHVSALYTDPEGVLWVGTRGAGACSFDGEEWEHHPVEDLGMDSVSSIFPGKEGQLWFTGPGGVTLREGSEWRHFSDELGREIRVAFAGCFDATDGSVWFATVAGAVRYDGEAWEWTTSRDGLRHDVLHDVLRDRSGNLWFATRRGGLSRRSADGEWEHFLPDENVRAILEDEDGGLWFGTGAGGAHHFDGEAWTAHHAGQTVLPLHAGGGNVWFSRDHGGALRYRDGQWTTHTEELPGGELGAVCSGPLESLWFGAAGGLNQVRKVK